MAATNKTNKWRTLLGLGLIFLAFWFNLSWVWAILFLIWVIPDLFTGITYFMEPLSRSENPLLYWLIMGTWLLMSGYMLVDSFAPQVLPQGWSSNSTYDSQYSTLEDVTCNTYDQSSNSIINSSKKAVLKYKSHISGAFNIVGMSAQTSYAQEDIAATYVGLWEAFLKENISAVIPDIIDDKVYIIQSDLDTNMEEDFTITIGYKTASLNDIYKGLNGVQVKASKYAVFETNKDVNTVWEQILLSDLESSNLNNVEVYHYNDKTQAIEKTDIWVSVPTSKSELAAVKSKNKPTQKSSTSYSEPVVVVQKSSETYKPSSKNTPITKQVEEANYNHSKEKIEVYENKYPIQKQSSFYVVGLQTNVNYNNKKAMSKAIEELWKKFLGRNYSKSKYIQDVDNNKHAYLTYTDYTENEVTITLGYKTQSNNNFKTGIGLNGVTIKANDYYNFELSNNSNDYKGEEWDTLLEILQYRAEDSADFEVYSFDNKYKITEIQMWMSVK